MGHGSHSEPSAFDSEGCGRIKEPEAHDCLAFQTGDLGAQKDGLEWYWRQRPGKNDKTVTYGFEKGLCDVLTWR